MLDPRRPYPLDVDGAKGGHASLVARTWVFTTNTDPRNWYNNQKFKTEDMWSSFERRVTHWIHWDSKRPDDGEWIGDSYTGGLLNTNMETIGLHGEKLYRVCRDNPVALLAYFDHKIPSPNLAAQIGQHTGAFAQRNTTRVWTDDDMLYDQNGKRRRTDSNNNNA